MSPATIAALVSGLTALVTAIGGVIALFKHATGPAHNPPSKM